LEASGLEPRSPSGDATKPEPVPGESRRSRYAGALMLFAGLERLDLWGLFRTLGASVGPWRRWGWVETMAAVVLCFALRFRSIADSKNALPEARPPSSADL